MESFNKLETERLILRRLEYADQKAFVSLMTNPAVTDNLAFDKFMKTEDGALTVLNQTIISYATRNPMHAYAIQQKHDNKFVGICGISPVDKNSMEVFYAFLPESWGRGLATETLTRLKEYLAADRNIIKVHAYIKPSNLASIRVAEKVNFIREGLVNKEHFEAKVYDYIFRNGG